MYQSFVIYLALIELLFVLSSFQHLRIIGGRSAHRRQFPYTVSLNQYGRQFCTGVIISPTWVATAAHCFHHVSGLDNIIVIAGMLRQDEEHPDIQTSKIKKYKIHPEYQDTSNIYDIALLELENEFVLNEAVDTVTLPEQDESFTGSGTISGWGLLKTFPPERSEVLQYTEMPLISTEKCNKRLRALDEYPFAVTKDHLCTLPRKPRESGCSGDSGGPLVQKGVLIGIVHGGSPWCGQMTNISSPTIFTRVSSCIPFIKKLVHNLSEDSEYH